jgi:outer membrane receptor for ferric coprogen and ferric-rhodotorulic acid
VGISRGFRAVFLGAASAAALGQAASADSADGGGGVETVVVQAQRVSTAVTGLQLSLRDTPQSVTVVDREQIEDFHLNNSNDLLDMIPGINVERVETDRTYYNSRGFDITNFQVDGIGMPLIWGIQFGDLDTAIFQRVEAVRGANGMMTGTGNPSATINYVRKRPTDTFELTASASYGSWDDRRFDFDIAGPLNGEGTVKGRFVYANEDKDSYLDYNHVNRNVAYGILSWDVTPNLTATAGYSWQDNRANGVMWGSLPLEYSDGTLIDYPVSASTSADWTYWNVRDQSGFGELAYRLDGGWQLKAVGTYKRFDENAKLLYAFGNPDPITGLGVAGMSGIYPSQYNQVMGDLYASGPFSLFGREHELVIGANVSHSHGLEWENFSAVFPVYPPIGSWGTVQVVEPPYPGAYLAADQTDDMSRIYAATHLNITDDLKVVAGFNAQKVKSKGYSYGTNTARDEGKVSPYIGAVYDLTEQVSLYASYTDIFNPQSEVDVTHKRLAPAHGKSYEAGVKSQWFDGLLYATASIFKSNQYGLANFAGTFPGGQSYYAPLDTFVKGYEFEVAGKLTEQWGIAGGWTQLSMEDTSGAPVRTFLPRKTLKLSNTYTIPSLSDLKLGAALRWQSDISTLDLVVVPQPSYAVLDLMASVALNDNIRASLNVNNVADKKYFASLMWNQAYYGAPRSVTVGLSYALNP